MKELTSRQVSILTFLSIISLKLIILPSLIYNVSANNSYISFIINMVADFFSIFAYFFFMKKFPNLSLKESLEKSFGKIFCKIFFGFLCLYFLIKSVVAVKEIQNYFNRVLFDDFGWIKYILPSLVLTIYITQKPLKTFGRSAEFLYYFVLLSTILVIISANSSAKLENLLPFMQNGINPILKGAFKSSFAFGDYLFFLLYLGNIKYSKSGKKTIIFYSIIAILLVTIIFIIFTSTFGKLSLNENIAISDISLNLPIPLTVGRLDWINIIIWCFLLFFQASLLLKSSLICFSNALNFKNKIIRESIIYSIFTTAILIKQFSLSEILKIITHPAFSIFAQIIQAGSPAILIICYFILKKKNYKPPLQIFRIKENKIKKFIKS